MDPKISEKKNLHETNAPRLRKKKLINDVKDLLEFYFSSVNIAKDKFMCDLLENDPYIDINIFHRFNKIKSLTNETKILQKAVKKSKLLELSSDELKVKRCSPWVMKENEMECTIYVENLPPNSTHEWLRKVFSTYGSIDYVSLPLFPQSGQPKGFAFIEFHTPEEAQQALVAYGGLASLDGILNPADLLSIRTYNKEDVCTNDSESQMPVMGMDSTISASTDETSIAGSGKRSADAAFLSQEVDAFESKSKRSKVEKDGLGDNATKTKKKRRRSKKGKEYEIDSVYLRVMSKKDWKSLRNKYLNTQRENMRRLKDYVQSHRNYHSCSPDVDYNTESTSGKSTKPIFQPDIIVKITLNEPPQDIKEFRAGIINGRTSIDYVDIMPGENVLYIRFKSPEASKEFVKEGLWEDVKILKEVEEAAYWDKVYGAWEKKRPKKNSKLLQQQVHSSYHDPTEERGRDKLVSKALKQKHSSKCSTHIVFDD